MGVRLKSVDEHFREKSKDPRLRELFGLEKEKAKIVSLIIKYRADHHLNQSQLARKVGVSQQYISKLEEGDFSNLATIQKVLLALGYHVALQAIPLDPQVRRAFQIAA